MPMRFIMVLALGIFVLRKRLIYTCMQQGRIHQSQRRVRDVSATTWLAPTNHRVAAFFFIRWRRRRRRYSRQQVSLRVYWFLTELPIHAELVVVPASSLARQERRARRCGVGERQCGRRTELAGGALLRRSGVQLTSDRTIVEMTRLEADADASKISDEHTSLITADHRSTATLIYPHESISSHSEMPAFELTFWHNHFVDFRLSSETTKYYKCCMLHAYSVFCLCCYICTSQSNSCSWREII